MTPDTVLGLVREAVIIILAMALPILGSALLVGLTVSIFQATTQIQEPTMVFVPKIIAVLVALMMFGGWIFRQMIQFTLRLWGDWLLPL